jgi:inorganic pyrophosphatase
MIPVVILELLKNDPIKQSISYNGVKIGIEWPKGSVRKYANSNFRKFMYAGYGYIKKTNSEDGEEIDVYLGDEKESPIIYRVEQLKSPYEAKKTGGTAYVTHDEYKFMIGFTSKEEAIKVYTKCMSKRFLGKVTELSWDKFKELINKNIEKTND